MSKRWAQEHARDPYCRMARRENYRSRAAYKLKQIDQKHHVMRKGDVVVDLGASPGGWSQIALELVGEEGVVIGVDLQPTPPLDGWIFIEGDITQDETRQEILSTLHDMGKKDVSVVISDMSPNISGNYDVDQANSAYLARIALEFAEDNIHPGGNFVCKIFQGSELEEFLRDTRSLFKSVRRYSPPASRKSSSEVYVICKARR
ncbi:MAG: RlmE family RNA methyltransferase [Thermoplasmata archaeon]|nr:RlmE family RNA methyltransferase [Thermoplasmata archaeon]